MTSLMTGQPMRTKMERMTRASVMIEPTMRPLLVLVVMNPPIALPMVKMSQNLGKALMTALTGVGKLDRHRTSVDPLPLLGLAIQKTRKTEMRMTGRNKMMSYLR